MYLCNWITLLYSLNIVFNYTSIKKIINSKKKKNEKETNWEMFLPFLISESLFNIGLTSSFNIWNDSLMRPSRCVFLHDKNFNNVFNFGHYFMSMDKLFFQWVWKN